MYVLYGNLTDKTKIPDNTQTFICPAYGLTELPILNNILECLYCGNNNLIYLPELPDGLKNLNCGNNKLVELPELPITLQQLDCTNNNIKYLSSHNCDVIKEINGGLYILNNPVSSGFDSNGEFKAYLRLI